MVNVLFMHPRFLYIHAAAHSSSLLLLLGCCACCIILLIGAFYTVHSDGAGPKCLVGLLLWVGDQRKLAAESFLGGDWWRTDPLHGSSSPPFTLPEQGAVSIDGGLGSICRGAAARFLQVVLLVTSLSNPPPPPLILWLQPTNLSTSPVVPTGLNYASSLSQAQRLEQRAATRSASFSESEPVKTLQWGTGVAVVKVVSHRAIVVT